MTVDERFEQLERKTQRLEKRNKRLTVGLTMMAVAMCAVVTMAATNIADGVMRYQFHQLNVSTSNNVYIKQYLLDRSTGDLWEVGGDKKKLVKLKQ
jgi:uncharacterized protein YycO